jgi:hypothetical protein
VFWTESFDKESGRRRKLASVTVHHIRKVTDVSFVQSK